MKVKPGNFAFGTMGEDEFLAACRHKEPKAQRELIRHFYGYVKSICLRYSSDDQDAEEILNDTFLKVFTNLEKYDHSQSLRNWIRTIAVNTAIDYYRRNLRRPVMENTEDLRVPEIGSSILDDLSAEEILSMVRQLSPVYRMVFSLYVIDGYSHREIAEKLGIQEGTSKSNLQDARKKLQLMILRNNPTLYAAYEMKKSTRNEE